VCIREVRREIEKNTHVFMIIKEEKEWITALIMDAKSETLEGSSYARQRLFT
jgi:hypothetical protein